jgi:hypothetical protein
MKTLRSEPNHTTSPQRHKNASANSPPHSSRLRNPEGVSPVPCAMAVSRSTQLQDRKGGKCVHDSRYVIGGYVDVVSTSDSAERGDEEEEKFG